MVADALAQALHAGVRLDFSRDPRRPVFRCPPALQELLDPLLVGDHKAALHGLLHHATGYRQVLLEFFRLTALGRRASVEACRHLVREEARFADELGPRLAAAVRRQVARAWCVETEHCPWCGERGEYHERPVTHE